MPFGRRKLRRMALGCGTVAVILLGVLFFTGFGKTFRTLWSHGFFDQYVSGDQERKYNASGTANLKALYTALMLYHESEGQFPVASGWMDAIKNRVAASDLAKGEADKKFVTPSLEGKPGQYGYAMNDAASGKYKGDVKDPKTPLIFDSSDTSRNAHGDPKKLLPSPARAGGNLGITVDGTIVKL
jgi:hypothetical protein